ncbi:MAG: endonuclease MutS2, partial [Chloroflexi bacterium]|nr:endonuclease MutS2 [Chloroflexota bacterium]
MDPKSLATLELPKVLDRLAKFTAFSGGAALARALTPTTDLAEAQRWQSETSEARKLLAVKTDVTLGGARDVRSLAVNAARGTVLLAPELMDVKGTIIAARNLRRILVKLSDQFPRLAFIAGGLNECPGIVEAISRTIDERGEVLDSASETLASIRRDLRVAHDRLLTKLQALISSSKYQTYLQEPIITQREGRYVIPLKADFKGKIRGIVHDQSASGATLFIEPLAAHDLNNGWRELQLKEQEEIRRILAELSAQIGAQAEAITNTVDALAELDLAFAKAKYA